jgi:sterol desaturase/sphingolipid hydroxylase (fatty acid hydroxylase superfamily)
VSLIESLTAAGSQVSEWGLQHADVAFRQLQEGTLLTTALISVFVCLELVRPASLGPTINDRLVNVLIGLIVSVFAFVCMLLTVGIAKLVWRDGLIGLVFTDWRSRGLPGTAVSVFVYGATWDFFQYWFHRWQHEIPLLWTSHRVHHSDSGVNTTTALRRSILELWLIFVFILIPTVVVAGVDEIAAPIAFAIFYGWGFFNHANIRFSLGPLTPVFSGPQWHRLHHAIDPQYRDRNYAAYFAIIDIVFGTYRAPRSDEHPATGVTDASATAHPLRDCIYPRRG